MDYQKHYLLLTSRGKSVRDIEYLETHHITPRCMGGENDPTNLTKLTPEEHYLAHQLLIKIFPGNSKLIYATAMMCGDKRGRRINNKVYGWLRRQISEMRTGVHFTDDHKRKLSEARTQRKTLPETRNRISASLRGRKKSEEHLEKIKQANAGRKRRPLNQQHKINIRQSVKKYHADMRNSTEYKDESSTLPNTRQSARETRHTHYFTGKPCKRGHVDRRSTKSGDCMGCWRSYNSRKLSNNLSLP